MNVASGTKRIRVVLGQDQRRVVAHGADVLPLASEQVLPLPVGVVGERDRDPLERFASGSVIDVPSKLLTRTPAPGFAFCLIVGNVGDPPVSSVGAVFSTATVMISVVLLNAVPGPALSGPHRRGTERTGPRRGRQGGRPGRRGRIRAEPDHVGRGR